MKEKGFALTDVIVAIVIIMLFTGVIVSVSYNIYLQSNFIKRNNKATNYIVEIFEYAKSLDFDNITFQNINSEFYSEHGINIAPMPENESNINLSTGYNIFLEIEDQELPQEEYVYAKKIKVDVRYKLGKKVKKVSMETLINN